MMECGNLSLLSSYADIQFAAGNAALASGWHEDRPVEPVDPSEQEAHEAALRNWQGMKMMLMVSELAEAVEEIRTGHEADEHYYSGVSLGVGASTQLWEDGVPMRKPEGVPSELADTVIRIMDFCFTEGIDLQEVILEKLAYNATRGRRHGNKTI